MNERVSDQQGDLLRAVWSVHPDPLLVSSGGRLVDVNPATVLTFGWERDWLLGRSPTVLAPTLPVTLGNSLPFRAKQADGGVFVAAASTVSLSPQVSGQEELRLTVVRDLTGLVSERQLLAADEMRAWERTLDSSRETLTQYLYGAGIALRSSLTAAGSETERARIDGVIGVLEELMTGLNPGTGR